MSEFHLIVVVSVDVRTDLRLRLAVTSWSSLYHMVGKPKNEQLLISECSIEKGFPQEEVHSGRSPGIAKS